MRSGSRFCVVFDLPRGSNTCEDHLHREDFPGQRIQHQPERFQRYGSEQRAVVSLAQNDGRRSGVFSDLETALGNPTLNCRAVGQREFYFSLRPQAQCAPNLLRHNRINRSRVNKKPYVMRFSAPIGPSQSSMYVRDPHGSERRAGNRQRQPLRTWWLLAAEIERFRRFLDAAARMTTRRESRGRSGRWHACGSAHTCKRT